VIPSGWPLVEIARLPRAVSFFVVARQPARRHPLINRRCAQPLMIYCCVAQKGIEL
jgi:hypothetical protein